MIKLCKPEMETNEDALLDRVRQVEEKLENGVVFSAAEGAALGGTQLGGDGNVVKAKPELPKAIPEDVKQIVAKWPAIAGSAENPMRIYLKSAKLSLGGDNKLMVVLEDGIPSDYFTQHPENKQQLEALLSDFSGKEIEVNIQTVRGQQEFEQSYVDLSQMVRMDIEEEEEDEN